MLLLCYVLLCPGIRVIMFWLSFKPCFQGIIWPQVITGVVVNLLNALINYILLYVLNLGVAWVSPCTWSPPTYCIFPHICWWLLHVACLILLNAIDRGSAAANTISQFSLALSLYAYIMWKGLHKTTWDGKYNICSEWDGWLWVTSYQSVNPHAGVFKLFWLGTPL